MKKHLKGLFLKDETHGLAINTIIILGKLFMHKNRFLKILPNFYAFHKELCHHYFLSLKRMKKNNALHFCNLIENLKLAENP